MVFPRTGLPNSVQVKTRQRVGYDSDDNPVFDTVLLFATPRPARFYRDQGREMTGASDTDVVEGMVAFPAEAGDTLDMVPSKAEIVVSRGQFSDVGDRYQVIHPTLQMLWNRPSHWEISVGRTR